MAHGDHYYHVYNRGCNRERIFRSDNNYRYLLGQVKRLLVGSDVALIAYCLMPNHYHFLLRSDAPHAVARFIQRLFSGYVQRPSTGGMAGAERCLKAARGVCPSRKRSMRFTFAAIFI